MSILRLFLQRVGILALSMALAVLAWWLLLVAFDVSPLVSRTPAQVASFLWNAPGTPEGSLLATAFLETLRDFGIGYVAGLAAAFSLALVFCLSVTAERIVMPSAMMLRTIPVIVLAPLLTLLFGIGVAGVTAIVVIVVFFPSLANVLVGLRDAQERYGDLVKAYRGSTGALLRTAVIPGAVPSIMASARIAVPAAATGAMIGEWLATGDGLGGYISRSVGSFGYDIVWSGAVLVTVFSMLAYTVVSLADAVAQRRFAAEIA